MDFKLTEFNCIESIENNSNVFTMHIRIHFKNGLGLSVVMGFGTHGNEKGLMEITPINKKGYFDESLFDEEDQGDFVRGYCDIKKVKYYIKKIGNIYYRGTK